MPLKQRYRASVKTQEINKNVQIFSAFSPKKENIRRHTVKPVLLHHQIDTRIPEFEISPAVPQINEFSHEDHMTKELEMQP